MRKIVLLVFIIVCSFKLNAQNIFTDDFSGYALAKIDGQNGWSSSTPSLGNGSGNCFSFDCNVKVVAKTMSFPNFNSCTQAINPIDGVLATGDGPGKSLGTNITSGSVYVALLVNMTAPASGTTPTGNKQLIRFMDNSFTTATRLYIKQSTGGGSFQVGIDKNGSAASFSSNTYAYGQDHLLILKYKFNTASSSDDVAAVFVNPDLTLPEPTPEISASGSTDAATITRVVFPWNSSSLITSGYIGIVSLAKDWSATSLPIPGVNNLQIIKNQSAKATLKWTIDNGNDINKFILQQSSNLVDYSETAVLTNEGNKTYSYDVDLKNGINYIRLVVVDHIGNKKFSNVLSVKSGNIAIKDLVLVPNPVVDHLNITISSNISKTITIEVLDLFGNIISKQHKAINAGETTLSNNVSNLKSGNYLLKITTLNGESQIGKFIKM